MIQFNKALSDALITHQAGAQFSLPEITQQAVAQLQIAEIPISKHYVAQHACSMKRRQRIFRANPKAPLSYSLNVLSFNQYCQSFQ